MHENITRVAERGERLDALQDKTGEPFFSIVVQALAERGLQCEGLEGGMRCRRRWLLERMAVVRRFGGWPRIWWWSCREGLCDAQSGQIGEACGEYQAKMRKKGQWIFSPEAREIADSAITGFAKFPCPPSPCPLSSDVS